MPARSLPKRVRQMRSTKPWRTATLTLFELAKFLSDNFLGDLDLLPMNHAAQLNNLGRLKQLHANDERCTVAAMDTAAERGHLKIVRFLNENRNDAFTTKAIECAATRGRLEVVSYLRLNRFKDKFTNTTNNAATSGELAIVKFLHANRIEGCITAAMNSAAAQKWLMMVKTLHDWRAEGCTTTAMDWAAANGFLEVVEFLQKNRTEDCTVKALDEAVLGGHWKVARFLLQNREEGCFDDLLNRLVRKIKRGDKHPPAEMMSLSITCTLSTQGCLFEARRIAQQRNQTFVVDLPNRYISEDVPSCSIRFHLKYGPRRCQKQSLHQTDSGAHIGAGRQ